VAFGKLEESPLGFGRLGQAQHLAQHNAQHFSQSVLQPLPAHAEGVRGAAHRFRDRHPIEFIHAIDSLLETMTQERPRVGDFFLAEHDGEESCSETGQGPMLLTLVLEEHEERGL
jgi:hypothetical protein